jgi:hypothetical protein
MKKYIVTYFYHDCEEQGASYGNIFLTLDERNLIYWQTVYTLFFSSIVSNKNCDVNLILFTNVADFPCRELIEKLGVKIYDNLSLTNRNPGKWATVKFFFDVIEFIDGHNDFDDDDAFVMLDTDVVALRSATPLFECLGTSKNPIIYAFDEVSDKGQDFHGTSISNLERFGLSAFGKQIDIKKLIGGEFFCFKKLQISEFNKYFNVFKNYDYSTQITTEEQILTLVNAQESWTLFPESIFRVWTTLRVFKMPKKNINYIFLHLPSEKEFGLNRLFNATKNISPCDMTENNFNLLFFRCMPLRQPYYIILSKLTNKIKAYFR